MLTRIYRTLTRHALPLAKLYLRHRAKRQPDYLLHWDERFGTGSFPAHGAAPRLWIHAVSVGETQAARSLIESALRQFPDVEILLTCMTPTGRDVGARIAQAHSGRIVQCYLPYDTPELMGKFLDETRPTMGVIMETEVWPNLMHEASQRRIPMVLANARESEKSRKSAARVLSLMQPAFSAFDVVLAQSEADAQRLKSLGARRIVVCGSVKFDIQADGKQVTAAKALKGRWTRPVVLLASTRQGEEEGFVKALDALPERALVWLVPRHPQRFDEVADMLKAHGVRFVRKSTNPDLEHLPDDIRVVLADTMGEMSFNCALADVCAMGGSYGGFGCQNLIEPASLGVPVIVGPSSFNFAKPVDDAVALGAACRVSDAKAAMQRAAQWLSDGQAAERREAALRFAHGYTGSTKRQMQEIEALWKSAVASPTR